MPLNISAEPTASFYSLSGRQIHFQEDTAAVVKIVGVAKSSSLNTDNDTPEFAVEFPLLYCYYVLKEITTGNISLIFEKRYRDQLGKARSNLGKNFRFGRTFPTEI